MTRKWCVIGANGMLGRELTRQLRERRADVTTITRQEFDIERDDPAALRVALDNRTVVNCAALPASSSQSALLQVNAIFPRRLAAMCRQLDAPLIHISSNGVFSGQRGMYAEDDIPDAFDRYGVSKLLGEDRGVMVLRTSIVGLEAANSKRYLVQWLVSNAGGEVDGYTNHHWNGVTVPTLARVIEGVVTADRWCAGIHHLHSPESVSKADLLGMIATAFRLSVAIRPVAAKESSNRTLTATSSVTRGLVTTSIAEQLHVLANSVLA